MVNCDGFAICRYRESDMLELRYLRTVFIKMLGFVLLQTYEKKTVFVLSLRCFPGAVVCLLRAFVVGG